MSDKESNSELNNTSELIVLRLYVAGMSQNSLLAIENIKKICDEYFTDFFELEIVDIYQHPEKLQEQQVLFSPSLIKELPLPKKILVGNFSDSKKVIKALGITIKD